MKLSPHDSSLDALKLVVDMADVPMVITDEDGCFVFANGHTLDIVGKAEDVCIGKTLASLISVSRRPRFNRSGKAPVLFTREGRFYEVDGISRFHTKSDTFELSRIHDVTSTYRDKEMLEFLKSDAPIGIFQFVMDEHFSFFYASEGFCAMHGYTQDQMKTDLDIRGSELIHPDHLQRFNDLIRAAYEDGKSSVGFEMKVIRRDGKVRWLLTQCSFVETVDGTIVYGYVSDCTDLKNMEEKTKSIQDVCRFTVNHDYEWILLVDIPADRYEYFFSGRNSMTGSGMQGVFSELVRLRSETVVHPDDVEAYRAFFKPERLAWENGTPGLSHELKYRVLMGNGQARERRRDYGMILIDWETPGMDDMETVRHIREIVGKATTPIVMSACDWREMEAPARSAGVDYFINKPILREHLRDMLLMVTHHRRAFDVPAMPEEIRFNREKLLIAEDNELNAEILKTLLESRNLSVVWAENGKVAAERFAESEPGEYAAILMDVRMPVMDGLEATRRIRGMTREDARRIPIFALSANAFADDIQRSLQCGMNTHFNKPVDMDSICAALHYWLEHDKGNRP